MTGALLLAATLNVGSLPPIEHSDCEVSTNGLPGVSVLTCLEREGVTTPQRVETEEELQTPAVAHYRPYQKLSTVAATSAALCKVTECFVGENKTGDIPENFIL